MQLREYQVEGIAKVYKAIREGCKRVLVYAPTGAGKTVLMAKMGQDAKSKGRSILYIVDNNNLVGQTLDKLAKVDIFPGLIKAGYKEDRDKSVQLASIDSLVRRDLPYADVVFIDEAHGSFAAKYDRVFEKYANKIIIGFSATPERTNKRESLIKRFDQLVKVTTIGQLVDEGFLVAPTVYSIAKNALKLEDVKITAGDYNQEQLGLKMSDPNVIKRAVDEWVRLGENRPTIAFAVHIAHSKALSSEFNKRGIPSEHLDGATTQNDREEMYKRLRNGKTKVLTSVNALSQGFDEPCVSCVLSCRPTKSKVIYIQQIGRGLRLHADKSNCIVIDQAENIWTLDHPMSYEPIGLDEPSSRKKGEAPVRECPQCAAVMPNFTSKCSNCGYVFPQKKKATSHGEMIEVTAKVKTIDPQQREFYKTYLHDAFKRGYSPDYAVVKFKDNYGYYPPANIKRGALFGYAPTAQNRLEYLGYLNNVAAKKNKDQSWIAKQMSSEFGKTSLQAA